MASGLVNEIEYAVYKLNTDMRIIEIDEQFTKMTGYTEQDIQENVIRQIDLIFEEDQEEYLALVGKNLEKSGEAYIEHRIRCKDGRERFVFCLGQIAATEDGGTVSVIRTMDVTNLIYMRVQAEKIRRENEDEVEQWMHLANIDELTGVLRRGAFLPAINDYIEKESDYTLLILDADDFKNVNDLCGHGVGDQVLKALANTFLEVTGDKGCVCRMGGDEFSIFLKGVGTVKEAEDFAAQIIGKVDDLGHITNHEVPIHISIGGMVHDQNGTFDLKKIFNYADDALYKVKKSGKNRFLIEEE